MMADLKGFKLSAKERLDKAANVPLPSPTIGVTGAFRAKPSAPAPTDAAPAVDDKPLPGQGDRQGNPAPAPEVEQKEPPAEPGRSDKPASPAAAEQKKSKRAPRDDAMLMFRPMLQFSKPMLPRAEAVAEKLRVGVEMLVRKVASETTVEAADFAGDDPAPRAGSIYRGRVRCPKAAAERHLANVDPLGLQDHGLVLRPICLRAFDRAAEKFFSDFERRTL